MLHFSKKSFFIKKEKGIYLAFFTFFAGIVITLLVFSKTTQIVTKEKQLEFSGQVKDITSDINTRLRIYTSLLESTKDFLFTIPPNELNQKKWDTYVSNLNLEKNYPDIVAFGYVVHVAASDIPALIAKMQSESAANFSIFPPGKQPEYNIVQYFSPIVNSSPVVGFNMSSEQVRRTALEKARDSGEIAFTSKVVILLDNQKKTQKSSVIAVFPIYKQNLPTQTTLQRQQALAGYLVTSFRVSDFIDAVLASNHSKLFLSVYDTDNLHPPSLANQLYTNIQDPQVLKNAPFTKQVIITYGQRPWIFSFTSLPVGQMYGAERFLAGFRLLGGILISILLFLLVYFLATAKERAVRMAKQLLKEAMKKDEFLSIAAHQLRTPLGTMRWTIERSIAGKYGKVSKEMHEELLSIYASNLQLIKLVNDLLDVSKITQEKLTNEPVAVDIIPLVDASVKEMSIVASQSFITMIFEHPRTQIGKVFVDPKLFHQIMENVLSNAIKYNKPHGKITIKINGNNHAVQISVADTGIGIPKKDQERVFEQFTRASNAAIANTEGTGLGLFIVKSYIALWDGRIWLDSEINKGTTLYMELPVMK